MLQTNWLLVPSMLGTRFPGLKSVITSPAVMTRAVLSRMWVSLTSQNVPIRWVSRSVGIIPHHQLAFWLSPFQRNSFLPWTWLCHCSNGLLDSYIGQTVFSSAIIINHLKIKSLRLEIELNGSSHLPHMDKAGFQLLCQKNHRHGGTDL